MSPEAPSIRVRCPAKLNLFLEVVRRRADGYHEIDTVMQAISLLDDLEVQARDDGELRLTCSDPSLPTDGRNLVVRAARALREATGCTAGATMRLTKRIPMQAGLGGGSSDAAADLAAVAAEVGSDVAFFLTGGTARCTGRGERVEPVACAAECFYVLVCPRVSVSTAAAYQKLRFPLTPVRRDATMACHSLVEGDVEGRGASLFNRLEAPAFAMYPALSEVKRRLMATGLFAGVAMTGSGSALFGLCPASQWMSARERVAGLGVGDVLSVRSMGRGVEVCGVA